MKASRYPLVASGAAQAAERAGAPVKSKRHAAQAAELTRQAQPGRAEIAKVVQGS